MRRPQETSHDSAPGQESFLDVVANLVGILIILVMVVGVNAQDALLKGVASPDDEQAKLQSGVASEQQAAANVERDINRELADKLERQAIEVDSRRAQRNQMLVVVTAAERMLKEKRGELDAAGQESYDQSRKLVEAQNELRVLENARRVAENATAPPAVVEHRPTPLAKTVFGREIHFRLAGGRLMYVPLEELVNLAQADAPRTLPRLKDAPEATATVGPIRGFKLRYTLKLQQYVADTGYGGVQQQKPVFDHCTLHAESSSAGEPFDVALRPDSLFRRELARVDPQTTTVTVWVYPDGFGQFRRLKDELYKLGFLTASRPMPEGVEIGGSPNGTRSVIQ
jgi:hypothetical protein